MLFEDYGNGLDSETRNHFIKLLKTHNYSKMVFCLRYPNKIYLEIPAHV